MRITYRQLRHYLDCLSESQLDCDVTIEDDGDTPWFGTFAIIGEDSDKGLEVNHPVIYCPAQTGLEPRMTDEMVAEHIASIYVDNGFGPVGG